MSNIINSIHGHKVYSDDKLQCVCIEFDYWGETKTLQVPYAEHRLCIAMPTNTKKRFSLPAVYSPALYIVEKHVHNSPIPPVPDHELQKKLIPFKDDGTGRDNTARLEKIGRCPAAMVCRNFYIHNGPGAGYFDLGNLYETAIIWLESDNIDMVDPTAKDYPERMLGMNNLRGRFYNGYSGAMWTSSVSITTYNWLINTAGFIIPVLNTMTLGFIPSRAV